MNLSDNSRRGLEAPNSLASDRSKFEDSHHIAERTNRARLKLSDRSSSRLYRRLFLECCTLLLLLPATEAQHSSSTDEPHHDDPHDDDHGGVHLIRVDWDNVSTLFIIAIYIFFAAIAKIVFHMIPKLGEYIPESCLLIVYGVLIGRVLMATVDDLSLHRLPTNTFFFFLLPPIILDAGYFMPNRLFFNNLGTILIFAVIGTLWNTFAIGITLWGFQQIDLFKVDINSMEIFLFSSLLSAVDPVAVLAIFEEVHVNDLLYIIVFGESLLNDAVSIVLYRMFAQFTRLGPDLITSSEVIKGVASFPIVALGGTVVGIIWGFMIGFATRFTYNALIIEPIFIFVMSYMAFLMAELFHFSGVLALIFCGITMKNYVQANIAPTSNTTVKYTLKMLSSCSETVIFIFLGLSTATRDDKWNVWFVVISIAACTVYRFVGVFFFTAIINRFRMEKLGFVDQIVCGYGGLRGAVSFALVSLIDENTIKDEKTRHMFVTTTITVVYFTVFVQGCTIKPLVEWLKVKRAQPHELCVTERVHERLMEHVVTSMEAIFGISGGHNQIRDKFRAIDKAYIRPLLVRDYKNVQELKLIQTYESLIVSEARNQLRLKQLQLRKEGKLKMSLIPEESEDLSAPATPAARTSVSTGQHFDFENFDDTIFIPAKGRKISYNRHVLDFGDLEDDEAAVGPATPIAVVGGRPVRKIGVSSGSYRPARVSREEIAQRLSNINAPNLNELIQQYYQNQHQQTQPQRLYSTSNNYRRRRNASSSGRQTPTSGRHSVASTSIPEDEEQVDANGAISALTTNNNELPDISNSATYDEVFEK